MLCGFLPAAPSFFGLHACLKRRECALDGLVCSFNDFVAKCLTKDPAQRPSAAQLLAHAFIVPSLVCASLRVFPLPPPPLLSTAAHFFLQMSKGPSPLLPAIKQAHAAREARHAKAASAAVLAQAKAASAQGAVGAAIALAKAAVGSAVHPIAASAPSVPPAQKPVPPPKPIFNRPTHRKNKSISFGLAPAPEHSSIPEHGSARSAGSEPSAKSHSQSTPTTPDSRLRHSHLPSAASSSAAAAASASTASASLSGSAAAADSTAGTDVAGAGVSASLSDSRASTPHSHSRASNSDLDSTTRSTPGVPSDVDDFEPVDDPNATVQAAAVTSSPVRRFSFES
jgi:serine/threonine protein kinase